jgi:hypothetical protein
MDDNLRNASLSIPYDLDRMENGWKLAIAFV